MRPPLISSGNNPISENLCTYSEAASMRPPLISSGNNPISENLCTYSEAASMRPPLISSGNSNLFITSKCAAQLQ